MKISIALKAAEMMQKEIMSRYPRYNVDNVDIHLIANKAVNSREKRARVLGEEFSQTWVIGMVHEVCMNILEQACQKYLPGQKQRQDGFWAEFWPDTVNFISAVVVPK